MECHCVTVKASSLENGTTRHSCFCYKLSEHDLELCHWYGKLLYIRPAKPDLQNKIDSFVKSSSIMD